MSRIRVVLVDRSADFLEAAANFLATDEAIEVIGRSPSCREALRHLSQTRPDIVVAELCLQGSNGAESLNRIKALPRAPRIIVLTPHDQPEYRAYVQSLGADGCVHKSAFGEQLLPLIHGLCG